MKTLQYYKQQFFMIKVLLLSTFFIFAYTFRCGHDHFDDKHEKVFLNDLTDSRFLQTTQNGRLRIFVDYTQLAEGTTTEINTIKRVMNITASYFYMLLNVTRLPRLYFPSNVKLECGSLKVPETYTKEGTIGDLGIICGNQVNQGVAYIAKSISCVHQESDKRPIWGTIIFNNFYLKYDQEGFQQVLFVGMHEMTHILGFSAGMYDMYPKGNPLVKQKNGNSEIYYLNSTQIQAQIVSYFKCNNSKGIPLEDQDGSMVGSHWQRKVLGNEFIVATNRKNAHVSRFTLALLDSTGWYTSVNYSLAEPSTWGLGKGCSFLLVDDCSSNQFCTESKKYLCDSDGTGIARCDIDPFTGACLVAKYFVNTICVDENYEIKNLNAKLNALERGGSSSRCFASDFRQTGVQTTIVNNRCYVSVCSSSGKSIYVMVGQFILVCSRQGQQIIAPVGLEGTLTCPRSFVSYCQSKKTCPYHCNKNGACINGRCLCTGRTFLSSSCADVSILIAPVGQSAGYFNAAINKDSALTNIFDLQPVISTINIPNNTVTAKQIVTYSINSKCIQGTTFDKLFGECVSCVDVFSCLNCDYNGCVSCDDGRTPQNGVCLTLG